MARPDLEHCDRAEARVGGVDYSFKGIAPSLPPTESSKQSTFDDGALPQRLGVCFHGSGQIRRAAGTEWHFAPSDKILTFGALPPTSLALTFGFQCQHPVPVRLCLSRRRVRAVCQRTSVPICAKGCRYTGLNFGVSRADPTCRVRCFHVYKSQVRSLLAFC